MNSTIFAFAIKHLTFSAVANVLNYLIMKTKTFQFSDKELSLLRSVLSNHLSDLRIDEITSVRVGLSVKSVRKELLVTDSILSKLYTI